MQLNIVFTIFILQKGSLYYFNKSIVKIYMRILLLNNLLIFIQFIFFVYFFDQVEAPPSTLSFYSITQWSGSTPGSLWEMTDSKPGPQPQKSGALPMKLPQETYTTITLIQIIELLTAKSLHNCVEL